MHRQDAVSYSISQGDTVNVVTFSHRRPRRLDHIMMRGRVYVKGLGASIQTVNFQSEALLLEGDLCFWEGSICGRRSK